MKTTEEILEAVKELQKANPHDEGIQKWIADNFPELAESEDERIRKVLIGWIKCEPLSSFENGFSQSQILAWLEKQGEQTSDKIEPKFRNGQWIVWQDKCYKVNDNGCGYELVDQDGLSTSLEYGTIDENAHLWGITKNAKAGDVLSDGTIIFIFKDLLSDGSVMSYCDYDTDSGESDAFCPLSVNLICSKITPATKEQREQLKKAMADAGCTFDFDKKELKKTEQNTAWSEDDEKILNEIFSVAARASLRKGTLFGKSYDYIKWQNWLKSLRPQNHWKPSDEQLNALEYFICSYGESGILAAYDPMLNAARTLLEQLKKLKG